MKRRKRSAVPILSVPKMWTASGRSTSPTAASRRFSHSAFFGAAATTKSAGFFTSTPNLAARSARAALLGREDERRGGLSSIHRVRGGRRRRVPAPSSTGVSAMNLAARAALRQLLHQRRVDADDHVGGQRVLDDLALAGCWPASSASISAISAPPPRAPARPAPPRTCAAPHAPPRPAFLVGVDDGVDARRRGDHVGHALEQIGVGVGHFSVERERDAQR